MTGQPRIAFRRLAETAILPRYQTEGSAGFDLHAAAPEDIPPGQWRAVETGWAVEIPPGYELQVRPRSGLALHQGVTVLNSPGTIDSDYRGPVKVILVNHGSAVFTVNPGDRIAQAVCAPVSHAVLHETKSLGASPRGEGGFGSTGL